ncbi:MAG: TPM domain-containing protein [Lachnospiraceae bacterium]|nr:TPM domain-containing protein [Lachnospiraceae bacterium]
MKKDIKAIIFTTLCMVAACLFMFAGGTTPVSAAEESEKVGKGCSDNYRIYDYTDAIDDSEEEQLEQRLWNISNKYGVDVAVIIDWERPSSIESEYSYKDEVWRTNEYAHQFYNAYEYSDDGVIFALVQSDRSWGIQGFGTLEKTIGSKYESIFEEMKSDLSADRYGDAVGVFADEMESLLAGFKTQWIKDLAFIIVVSLVIGLIIGLIRASALKAQLKSVAVKTEASDYIVPGSFNLRNSRDFFLYKTVSRVKRESSSSSGSSHSSGGRSSSGGGGHY